MGKSIRLVFLVLSTLLSAIIAGCGDQSSANLPVPGADQLATSLATKTSCAAVVNSDARNGNFGGKQTLPQGRQKWYFEKTKFDQGYYAGLGSNIIISNGLVVFDYRGKQGNKTKGVLNGTLFAIDPQTGSEKWTVPLNVGQVQEVDGMIIGQNLQEDINQSYAISPTDGQIKCNEKIDATSKPINADGVEYKIVYGQESGVQAINADNGDEVWKWLLNSGPGNANETITSKSVMMKDGVIYVVGVRDEKPFGKFDTLHVLDAKTGQEKWSWRPENRSNSSSPQIYNGNVYLVAREEVNKNEPAYSKDPIYYFYALDSQTGQQKWSVKTDLGQVSKIYSDNNVIFLQGGTYNMDQYDLSGYGHSTENRDVFVAYDSITGQEKWRYPSEYGSIGSPAFVAGVVLATVPIKSDPNDPNSGGSGRYSYRNYYRGALVGLDENTGQEKWRFTHPYDSLGDPIFWDGMIFIPYKDGVLALE